MVLERGLDYWVQSHLNAIGNIGKDPKGGLTRLAYSPEEDEAHEYAAGQLAGAGFSVWKDAYLNTIASRGQGRRVMIGTHLDTVRQGGNYDGVVGFIAALEATKRIDKSLGIDIVIFRSEESSRFSKACLGSSAAFGILKSKEAAMTKCTMTGSGLYEVLAQSGGNPSKLGTPSLNAPDYAAYFEVHIEQAPMLESKGIDLGIVTSIRAPLRYEFKVTGPGCVAAASSMICALESNAIAAEMRGQDIVATVGKIDGFFTAFPGNINTIPEKAVFKTKDNIQDILDNVRKTRDVAYEQKQIPEGFEVTITGKANHSGGTPMIGRKDALAAAAQSAYYWTLANPYSQIATAMTFFTDVRSNDARIRDAFQQRIIESYQRLATPGIAIRPRQTENSEPAPSLDKGLQSMLKSSSDELGIPNMYIASGAGHDALKVYQAGIPVAMLFVPSKDGRSHCPQESTDMKYIIDAINVLERTLIKQFA
jgi:allantoate deiminase